MQGRTELKQWKGQNGIGQMEENKTNICAWACAWTSVHDACGHVCRHVFGHEQKCVCACAWEGVLGR